MPTIRETIRTELRADEAFAFIADFANAPAWDPGTATSERVDEGPVRVGARYRLGVRMRGKVVPMEYRIETFEPSRRVVLRGEGSGVVARDEITFRSDGTGARIDYVAEIHLQGVLRILEPFLGGAFARIGRDARDGMQRVLDDRRTSARLDAFARPTR
ncbi:MAG TPA: SRPBCC family protein [Patescibacteria group bacterium]|nr:SRPBCC family protein [Patescibacteria group bacterium]